MFIRQWEKTRDAERGETQISQEQKKKENEKLLQIDSTKFEEAEK